MGKADKAAKVTTCPRCGAMVFEDSDTCPACLCDTSRGRVAQAVEDRAWGIVLDYLAQTGYQDPRQWGCGMNGYITAGDGDGGDVVAKVIVSDADGIPALPVGTALVGEMRHALLAFCDETGSDKARADVIAISVRKDNAGTIRHLTQLCAIDVDATY